MPDQNKTDVFDIGDCILFNNMNENEIDESLKFFNARKTNYDKDNIIFHAGEKTKTLGVVLSGSVTVESNDLWGNLTILTIIKKGGIFAETYALLNETLLVDAVANEKSEIILLNVGNLNSFVDFENTWINKFILNLLSVSARKNLILSAKNFDTSAKSIRKRVMSYLNAESIKKHSRSFDIPFNRHQFADYLNVERTALSKELGKMKRENLIDYHKNHFQIL